MAFDIEVKAKNRLFDRINFSTQNECWEWVGGCDSKGYGQIKINGRYVLVHRLMWALHYGEWPENICVCHKCDNPKCCNPEHLFLGTRADNIKDMVKKKRHKWLYGERHGSSKITEEDAIRIIRMYKNGAGVKQISGILSIGYYTVWDICNNRSWKYLDRNIK